MSAYLVHELWRAFLETVTMVGVAATIAWFGGLCLAILLTVSAPGGLFERPMLNRVLGALVNGFRATPFIILLVALIPSTRWLAGTTIGVWAAIVPMSISATPFFARVAEVSLREIRPGVTEAARAMGLSRWRIVFEVMLPEALPGVIGGFTITLVAMVNASAMADAIGAGGLGDLAIRYGYQRYETHVMVVVIAILIVLVCVIQFIGDRLARHLEHG